RNSVLSVTMDWPSGENVSDQIGPSKPVIVRCNLPVAVCQSSTRPKCLAALPSLLATAAVSPSVETATSTSGTLRASTGGRQTWAEAAATKNSTPRKSLVVSLLLVLLFQPQSKPESHLPEGLFEKQSPDTGSTRVDFRLYLSGA